MRFHTLQSILAISIVAIAFPASAQDDSDDEYLEEITVYGSNYADSLRKSLNAKRNSAVVSEALTAEDLGQLPGNQCLRGAWTTPWCHRSTRSRWCRLCQHSWHGISSDERHLERARYREHVR